MIKITIGSKGDKRYETVIESDVAKPVTAKAKSEKKPREYAYPFLTMTPGQSFLVPDLETAQRTQRGGYQKPYFAKVSYAPAEGEENNGKYRVWLDAFRPSPEEVEAELALQKPDRDEAARKAAAKVLGQ